MPYQKQDTTAEEILQGNGNQDDWTKEVVLRLPADLEEQAMKLKAFERKRSIGSATDLLRGLLAYVYTAHSFQHLSMWSVLAGLADVSANDWRKRLQKASGWLDWQMPRSARDGFIGLSVASARRFETDLVDRWNPLEVFGPSRYRLASAYGL